MSSSFKRFTQPVGVNGLIQAWNDGTPVESISIRVNGAFEDPLVIMFLDDGIQIGELYLQFDGLESESLFLEDLYFALEEYNEVPQESRISNGKKDVTVDQLIADVRKDL